MCSPLAGKNLKHLNTSQELNSSGCLDLSIKDVFVIVHFEESDPGNEYEILSEKDLSYSWDTLAPGVGVEVKFGIARVYGTVIAVSDDLNYLDKNFKSIIESHQLEMSLRNDEKEKNLSKLKRNHKSDIERHVIKVTDKETQTEKVSNEMPDPTNYKEYLQMKMKYDKLEEEFDKFKALMSEVKSNLELAMSKMNNFNFSEKVLKSIENEKESDQDFNKMVQIGSGGTKIPERVYQSLNWHNYSVSTRKLLITLFPRSILATHSLTGKPSPAFTGSNKTPKLRLDPAIISDIVELICRKCKVTKSMVRNAITLKCADENKLHKRRLQKKKVNQDDIENQF